MGSAAGGDRAALPDDGSARPPAAGAGAGNRDNAERAYNLIMKEKEKLLAFETPLKFIFSHLALKEGWDNPKVFQICTLREMGTERERRQTIGRGRRAVPLRKGSDGKAVYLSDH